MVADVEYQKRWVALDLTSPINETDIIFANRATSNFTHKQGKLL